MTMTKRWLSGIMFTKLPQSPQQSSIQWPLSYSGRNILFIFGWIQHLEATSKGIFGFIVGYQSSCSLSVQFLWSCRSMCWQACQSLLYGFLTSTTLVNIPQYEAIHHNMSIVMMIANIIFCLSSRTRLACWERTWLSGYVGTSTKNKMYSKYIRIIVCTFGRNFEYRK